MTCVNPCRNAHFGHLKGSSSCLGRWVALKWVVEINEQLRQILRVGDFIAQNINKQEIS